MKNHRFLIEFWMFIHHKFVLKTMRKRIQAKTKYNNIKTHVKWDIKI